MIGWFVWGAMNLARAVEYSVQTGRALSISFEWLFPLTGFVASESGIDYRILVASAFVLVAPGLDFVLSGFGMSRLT